MGLLAARELAQQVYDLAAAARAGQRRARARRGGARHLRSGRPDGPGDAGRTGALRGDRRGRSAKPAPRPSAPRDQDRARHGRGGDQFGRRHFGPHDGLYLDQREMRRAAQFGPGDRRRAAGHGQERAGDEHGLCLRRAAAERPPRRDRGRQEPGGGGGDVQPRDVERSARLAHLGRACQDREPEPQDRQDQPRRVPAPVLCQPDARRTAALPRRYARAYHRRAAHPARGG